MIQFVCLIGLLLVFALAIWSHRSVLIKQSEERNQYLLKHLESHDRLHNDLLIVCEALLQKSGVPVNLIQRTQELKKARPGHYSTRPFPPLSEEEKQSAPSWYEQSATRNHCG